MRSSTMAAFAARPRPRFALRVGRKLASASPLLATTLLTGAIFLLPATGARQEAQASAGAPDISTVLAAYGK